MPDINSLIEKIETIKNVLQSYGADPLRTAIELEKLGLTTRKADIEERKLGALEKAQELQEREAARTREAERIKSLKAEDVRRGVESDLIQAKGAGGYQLPVDAIRLTGGMLKEPGDSDFSTRTGIYATNLPGQDEYGGYIPGSYTNLGAYARPLSPEQEQTVEDLRSALYGTEKGKKKGPTETEAKAKYILERWKAITAAGGMTIPNPDDPDEQIYATPEQISEMLKKEADAIYGKTKDEKSIRDMLRREVIHQRTPVYDVRAGKYVKGGPPTRGLTPPAEKPTIAEKAAPKKTQVKAGQRIVDESTGEMYVMSMKGTPLPVSDTAIEEPPLHQAPGHEALKRVGRGVGKGAKSFLAYMKEGGGYKEYGSDVMEELSKSFKKPTIKPVADKKRDFAIALDTEENIFERPGPEVVKKLGAFLEKTSERITSFLVSIINGTLDVDKANEFVSVWAKEHGKSKTEAKKEIKELVKFVRQKMPYRPEIPRFRGKMPERPYVPTYRATMPPGQRYKIARNQ